MLGEVVSITSGFPFKSALFGDAGPIPVVRNRDVARGYSTTFYTGPFSEEFAVNDGDLLVAMDGDFRTALWKGGRALLNQRVCRIDVDPLVVDKGFLRFCLPRELRRIQDATPYATVQHLSTKTIAAIRIHLPSLAEQQRIAAVLDRAADIRRKREESLRLLDEFLRSAFLEMFGDPVRNEKGWEVLPLERIADVQGGLQVTARRVSNAKDVPYLRVANVYRDRLDLREIKKLRVTDDELERTRLQAGDVLVVEGHGNPEEIGRSAVWDGSIDPCVHQNHLIRVRADKTMAESDYLSAFLNSAGGRRQMFRFGKTTSGLNTISTGNVRRVQVMLPPIDLQRRNSRLRAEVLASGQRIETAAREADSLFDSLAQRAFRGEL